MTVRVTMEQRDESKQEIASRLSRAARDHSGKPIIYTVLRSAGNRGATRRITAFVVVDNVPTSLSWHYDRAHGRVADGSGGTWANKVQGGGMDAGYQLAHSIAAVAALDHRSFRHEWL